MASTGWRYPTAATTATNVSGNAPWTSPTGALADDAAYATSALNTSNPQSQYLVLTGYGFDVPAGATIDGVERRPKAKSTGLNGNLGFHRSRLVKGGVIGATDDSSGTVTTTEQEFVHGGPADTAGEALTPTDVNAAGFGCALAFARIASGTASLNTAAMQVHYTLPARPAGHRLVAGPSCPVPLIAGV